MLVTDIAQHWLIKTGIYHKAAYLNICYYINSTEISSAVKWYELNVTESQSIFIATNFLS
jgi:hypothetical protein